MGNISLMPTSLPTLSINSAYNLAYSKGPPGGWKKQSDFTTMQIFSDRKDYSYWDYDFEQLARWEDSTLKPWLNSISHLKN